MKFSELVRCPFCGFTEFYQKYQYQGIGIYFFNFDGTGTDNTSMYDGVSGTSSGRAYCSDCRRYLGNSFKDVVGKKAEAALRKESEHGTRT